MTARGVTTSPVPDGGRTFQIDFDFVGHTLAIATSDGAERVLPLRARTVADFPAELLGELEGLGIGVAIHGRPNEVEEAIPYADDRTHAAYEPDAA